MSTRLRFILSCSFCVILAMFYSTTNLAIGHGGGGGGGGGGHGGGGFGGGGGHMGGYGGGYGHAGSFSGQASHPGPGPHPGPHPGPYPGPRYYGYGWDSSWAWWPWWGWYDWPAGGYFLRPGFGFDWPVRYSDFYGSQSSGDAYIDTVYNINPEVVATPDASDAAGSPATYVSPDSALANSLMTNSTSVSAMLAESDRPLTDASATTRSAWKPSSAWNATADRTNPFYQQGVAAFRQGNYRDAAHLAAHAAVDEPRNPNVHILLMLGMFAAGEYRVAAIEAHAVASLGKTPDWTAVYELYGDVTPYTEQLRKLEKNAANKPKSAESHFLVGYLYMVTGFKDAARDEFLDALKLTPRDRLAAQLLKSQGGTVPDDIAKQLAEMPPLSDKDGDASKPQTPPAPQPPPSKSATKPAS